MNSATRGARAASLPILLATLALAGCQIFDTRPAVTVLPAGTIVARDWIDLRVEAGGAPTARILIDGAPVGDPVSTDADVRLDIRTVSEGIHELVARVEQSSAPRTSTPRRLEVRRFGYRVPVTVTGISGPWEPIVVEVRSPDPLARVTATARAGGTDLPCEAAVPSADRRAWTVAVGGGTVKDLGGVHVEVGVVDDMGLSGSGSFGTTMPSRVAVTFQQPSGEVAPPVRVVASTAVRVPSATFFAKPVGGVAFPVREVGPSPWDLTLSQAELGPGAYTFEFRRDDVLLDGSASAVVSGTSAITSCASEAGGAAVTPQRCGLVTYQVIPARVELAGTAFGESPPGDLAITRISDATWRICPSVSRWKRGPVGFAARVAAYDVTGAVMDRSSCAFTLGWRWTDPGADPVTDGAAAIRGNVLAVHAIVPEAARVAVLGVSGTPDAGAIRIASKAQSPGVFSWGPTLNSTPAAEVVANLGRADGVAWTSPRAPGSAEGFLAESPGLVWTTWALTAGAVQGNRSPALGSGLYGPQVVTWVEDSGAGGSVAQVRSGAGAWGLLAPLTSWVADGRVEAPSVALTGPGGTTFHVAFLDVWPDASQRARVMAWSGSDWRDVPFPVTTTMFGPRSSDVATVHLLADGAAARMYLRSRTLGIRAFDWVPDPAAPYWQEGSAHLEPPSGVIRADAFAAGMPTDGRAAVAVLSFTRPDGQAEVWVCPTSSGRDCASLGPLTGAPHQAIALDPDSMTVAWTASDGTVHVRTLTP